MSMDHLTPQSGFANLVGYQLTIWRDDYAEVTLQVEEKHMNRSGVLHGGVVTTILDAACGYAGCYSADPDSPRRAFTLSLDCQFLGTVKAGSRITVEARKSGGGRNIFFAKADVFDDERRVIAQGAGTFRYRSSG